MQQHNSLQSHKVGALLTVRRDPYGREKGILVVEVSFSGAYGKLCQHTTLAPTFAQDGRTCDPHCPTGWDSTATCGGGDGSARRGGMSNSGDAQSYRLFCFYVETFVLLLACYCCCRYLLIGASVLLPWGGSLVLGSIPGPW